jgi:enolase
VNSIKMAKYTFHKSDATTLSSSDRASKLLGENWVRSTLIASIEDGMAEDDWDGRASPDDAEVPVPDSCDDLFVTNVCPTHCSKGD